MASLPLSPASWAWSARKGRRGKKREGYGAGAVYVCVQGEDGRVVSIRELMLLLLCCCCCCCCCAACKGKAAWNNCDQNEMPPPALLAEVIKRKPGDKQQGNYTTRTRRSMLHVHCVLCGMRSVLVKGRMSGRTGQEVWRPRRARRAGPSNPRSKTKQGKAPPGQPARREWTHAVQQPVCRQQSAD